MLLKNKEYFKIFDILKNYLKFNLEDIYLKKINDISNALMGINSFSFNEIDPVHLYN